MGGGVGSAATGPASVMQLGVDNKDNSNFHGTMRNLKIFNVLQHTASTYTPDF
jgi:hypothetical protein